VEALDRYQRASQDARRKAATPFVLVTGENRIAGYYTLSANIILAEDLPAEMVKKIKVAALPGIASNTHRASRLRSYVSRSRYRGTIAYGCAETGAEDECASRLIGGGR